MKYGKLVRDGMPEYIKRKGATPIFHIADEKEYWEKLKAKLQEEAAEFAQSEAASEVVDILEVLDAICAYKNFGKTDIEALKNKKAAERGKFKNKVILDES